MADWLTHERRNWIAGVIVAALGAYSLGNGHTTTSAVEHISYQLGDTKHQASCEHRRADKATAIAGKAIIAANVDSAPAPQFRDLPVDNCDRSAK